MLLPLRKPQTSSSQELLLWTWSGECMLSLALAWFNPSFPSLDLEFFVIYSALRKYSAPLNFATFCHISGFKHKDIKLYSFVKNQQQVGHNHEVERHLLYISNFFSNSKTEKLVVQNYSAPLLSVQQKIGRASCRERV